MIKLSKFVGFMICLMLAVVIWNLIAVLMSAVSITGLVVWLLQFTVTTVLVGTGFFNKTYKAVMCVIEALFDECSSREVS